MNLIQQLIDAGPLYWFWVASAVWFCVMLEVLFDRRN